MLIFLIGSYNPVQKLLFEDSTALPLCFPRVISVSHRNANEKVPMENEALYLIRKEIALPVLEVWVQGVADMNPLDLGPFILIIFIDGKYLKDILISNGSRVLKDDISNDTMEMVYRQMANIMLQLFKIDFFLRIGSLPAITTNFVVSTRTLTWKAHDILRTGGLKNFGIYISRDSEYIYSLSHLYYRQESPTTWQYLHYVLGKDWQ